MMKLWGRRNSFNVQKVLWMIAELGLPFEHIPAGGSWGRLAEPGVLAINPHGRVPVLEDAELTVWESHAILRYLAAKYGRPRFWPHDPAQRAPADGWMDWAQTALQPAFLDGVFWGFYRTPEADRDWPAIEASLTRCADCFAILDRALGGGRYLLGDELTLADIPAGTSLYRYFELDIPRPNLPNLARWYDRLQSRLAFAEHVMVPFDDLKGRLVS